MTSMRAFLVLLAVAALSACRASDDSAGTTNPDVTTPVEAPADAADPDVVADSTAE